MFLPPGCCRLSIRSRTESGGGGADLLRRITLTDRLIVDKQLDSTAAAVARTVICWMLSWMTTVLHPSLSLLHKEGGSSVPLVPVDAAAAPALVSLCHHYGVTRQGSCRMAGNKKVWVCGGGGGGVRSHTGVRWPSRRPSVFMHLRPRKGDRAPGDPEGEGGATQPGATRHMTRWGSSLSN